jgi:hypothetical protein
MTAILLAACKAADDAAGPESWSIAADPSLSIGVEEGDSVYLFQRIADARFVGADRIVVADARLLVLREYDRDGKFIAQRGGKGGGPGQFESLGHIWIVPPDTVVTWDNQTLRLTYFGGDGTPVRTVGLQSANAAVGPGRLDFLAGALQDGSLVFAKVALAGAGGPDSVSIETIGQDGKHLRRVAETTGMIRARLAEKVNGPIPFSSFPYVATYGDVIYYMNGTEPMVRAWSAAGERTIPFPAHEYDVEREWSAFVTKLETENRQPFVSVVATAPRPEWIPHLGGLLVDDTGRIWAKRYDPGTDAIWLGGGARAVGGTWWVADPAGRLVAQVQVPAGFAPLQVADTRALGVSVDSLGVERIEVRTISRPR